MSEHAEMSSGPTTPSIACSAAAQRMRAHRKRRRAGLRCVVVQLRETEIEDRSRLMRVTTSARSATPFTVILIRRYVHERDA
jgi:hypothetical protein